MTESTSPADDLAQLRDVIKGQRTCMLATIDPDGRIVSRPMSVQDAPFDGDLWFLAELESEKIAELERDAHASAIFATGDAWASVAGTASIVRDVERKREFWGPFTDAFFGKRGPEDESIVIIRLQGERGEYWTSHTGPRVLVELLASKVSGHRAETGDNAEVDLDRATA